MFCNIIKKINQEFFMKIKFNLLGIIVKCLLTFICFKFIDKYYVFENKFFVILGIFIFINILITFLYYLVDKYENRRYFNEKDYGHQGARNYIKIETKKPKYKSSNNELLSLIKQYKKNNKSGGQK